MALEGNVSADAEKLASAMKSCGFDIESLMQAIRRLRGKDSPHQKTVRRFLEGGRVQNGSAVAVSEALGLALSDIALKRDNRSDLTSKFVGDWIAMFVEPNRHKVRSFATERVRFSQAQTGKLIAVSTYMSESYEGGEKVFYDYIELVDDTLIVKSHMDGWVPPTGQSCYVVQIKEAYQVMEGVVIWVDSSTHQVEKSVIIFVKDPEINERLVETYCIVVKSTICHIPEGDMAVS